jgi:hypothetical protein
MHYNASSHSKGNVVNSILKKKIFADNKNETEVSWKGIKPDGIAKKRRKNHLKEGNIIRKKR